MTVECALNVARGARWDDDGFASHEQRLDHARVGVVGFVGQYRGCGSFFEQDVSAVQIVNFPGRQVKTR